MNRFDDLMESWLCDPDVRLPRPRQKRPPELGELDEYVRMELRRKDDDDADTIEYRG